MRKLRRLTSLIIALVFVVTSLLVMEPMSQVMSEAAAGKKQQVPASKNKIIVKYKTQGNQDNVQKRVKSKLKLAKLDRKKKFRHVNVDVLEIGVNDNMKNILNELNKDADVEYAQPDYLLEIQAVPTDIRFNEQWGLANSGQAVEGVTGRSGVDIKALNAWNLTKGSSSVVVGVLDTGIDINHIDLKNAIYVNTKDIPNNGIDDDNNGYIDDVKGWDFVNEDSNVYDSSSLDLHGTQVAGIIAASSNSEGITGVAPNVKILPLKFINGNWGYTCDAIEAIDYAIGMGVKIVNCSFGGTDDNFALKDTMVNSGILFVCAAGNRGADVAVSPVYPACFNIPNVLSVASIDSMGVLSPYSSYGNKIHVAAPGINILTTMPDGGYDFASGTSASAPMVAGTAALLKSKTPSLTYQQIAQRIKDNVVPCTNLQGKVTSGGRVDANAALNNVKPATDTYNGPGNDQGTVAAGQQGGNIDTWYTLDQLAKIKERMHYGESGVNPASGNFSITNNDMSMLAPGFSINISRTYNSRDDDYTPIGKGWTFGFEGKIEGTDVLDATLPNGSTQRFRLQNGVYNPEDSRSKLVKNADGSYTLTTKDQYSYYFNTNRYLYKMEDRNGNAVTMEVATDGRVTKITDAVGRFYTVNYNTNNLIDNIVAPGSLATVKYVYDSNYRLINVTDAMGGVTTYGYDGYGFLNEIKDHYNKTLIKLTYNHSEGENQHKVSQAIDCYGNTINYTYDMLNKKTSTTDSNGRVYSYWFDVSMYTIRVQDPEGRSTYTDYYMTNGLNKFGDVKSTTDRYGNKTQYEIDSVGNVTKITYPDFTTKEFVYDDKNNLTTEKNEAGIYTFHIYDADKKLLQKDAIPLNGTDKYTPGCDESKFAVTNYIYYTAAEAQTQVGCIVNGLLKSVTDPNGNPTTYTYDNHANIKTEKDAEGNTTTYDYNIVGYKTSITTPKGYITNMTYDKNGQLEKIVQHGGETTRILYDKVGQKTQEISAKQYDSTKDDLANHAYTDVNAGYKYAYYDSGLISKVTDPLGYETSYTYDKYGNKLTETRGNQSILRYEYDALDRPTKTYFKANAQAVEVLLAEYSYALLDDGRTQNTEKKYLNDNETAVTVSIYDCRGRLVETQYPDGTRDKTEYNPDGTVNTTTAKDGSITYYKYDGMGRQTEQWSPLEISDGGTLYTYIQIKYDKAGRKTAVKNGKEKVALYGVPAKFASIDYTYYNNNKLKTETDAEGRKKEYHYDADGNLDIEQVYTSAAKFIKTEYINNYLGKPTTKKFHVSEGDLYGYTYTSAVDKVLWTSYTYDKNGNLESILTPNNVKTTYTYDYLNRQLTTSQPGVDEQGNPVTVTTSAEYGWDGKVKSQTDAKGNGTSYEYDAMGNPVKVTDAKTKTAYNVYDRAGRKIAEVSPKNYDLAKNIDNMNRTEYVYDKMGRLKAKKFVFVDPKTNQWTTIYSKTFKYDEDGKVMKELDALGYESGTGASEDEKINTGYGTSYTYDLAGHTRTVLDPVSEQKGLAYTVKYEYDALGRKVSETNAKGVITSYAYDDAGNVLSVQVKKNATSTAQTLSEATYDWIGRKLTVTDGNGNVTTVEYNNLGKERKIVTPGDESIPANTITFQYDPMGNLKQKKDVLGKVQIFNYDNQGHVLNAGEKKSDNSQPIWTSAKYDKNGNVRFKTDGNSKITENIYDELNRLTETNITVNGITKRTQYGYDEDSNQTTVTDWRNAVFTNIYDPLGRLIEKADPYTTIQKLEYNSNSLQVKSFDALGKMTQFGYDANGRQIFTIDPEGHVTSQSYDEVGNVQSKTDGRSLTTTYNYNEFNQLVSVTNAKGETTTYTYDLNGNKQTQTDAKGNTSTIEYNAANLPIRRIDHGGRLGTPGSYTYVKAKVESYTYNADGSLKTKTDRNGKVTVYTYDIHGRIKSQAIGENAISYTYDNNGNQLDMIDSTGTTTRTYDEENRVLTKTVPQIGTTNFQYDILESDGSYSETTTDPKGNITKRTYDKAGRLVQVTADGKTTTYEYYANGSRQKVLYPNGSAETYTYYADGQVKTLVNTKSGGAVIDAYSYTYDNAHNQATKTDAKGLTKYDYDSLNRLMKVTEPSGKITSYVFDKAGNRVQETMIQGSNSTTTTYSYNEQNRLMSTTTRNGSVTEINRYEYDNNGNTLSKIKETTKPVDVGGTGSFKFYVMGKDAEKEGAFYKYDVWNQMIKAVEGDQTVVSSYNGDGLRVEKTVNGAATRYLYESDKVILEVDGNNGQIAHNVYGTNLLARSVDGQQLFYMYNGHADVTALMDATMGNTVATYYYDAFGTPVETTGTVNNPIRYAGYQYDTETGLYYLNARYYDSKIARFMTEDTYLGDPSDPLSLNLYTYCNNEPMMYSDPTGHTAYEDGKAQVARDVKSDASDEELDDKLTAQYQSLESATSEEEKEIYRGRIAALEDMLVDRYGIEVNDEKDRDRARTFAVEIRGLEAVVNGDAYHAKYYSLGSAQINAGMHKSTTAVGDNDITVINTGFLIAYNGNTYDGPGIFSQSKIKKRAQPVGVTMEEIDSIADQYIEQMLLELLTSSENLYESSALAYKISEYTTAANDLELIDGYSSSKKYGKLISGSALKLARELPIKDLLDFISESTVEYLDEAFYEPSDSVKYALEKELAIISTQIDCMGDYKFLICDKNARKQYVNILDQKLKQYSSMNIDYFKDQTNNELLKSQILTRISEIKMLNENYKKSDKEYKRIMKEVREGCNNAFEFQEQMYLNDYFKKLYGFDIIA